MRVSDVWFRLAGEGQTFSGEGECTWVKADTVHRCLEPAATITPDAHAASLSLSAGELLPREACRVLPATLSVAMQLQ